MNGNSLALSFKILFLALIPDRRPDREQLYMKPPWLIYRPLFKNKNSSFKKLPKMACYGINFDRVRQPVHSDDENDMIKCSVLPTGNSQDQDCAIMVKFWFLLSLWFLNLDYYARLTCVVLILNGLQYSIHRPVAHETFFRIKCQKLCEVWAKKSRERRKRKRKSATMMTTGMIRAFTRGQKSTLTVTRYFTKFIFILLLF